MPIIELVHTATFDADMDRLRRQCFPGAYPTGSSKDEFDDGSVHIIARADGRVAGAGRLIPRPTAFYRRTFEGRVVVPDQPDVVYFGRVMVAPEHRGHDLFELVMVEGLLHCSGAGFRLVFGGMRPDRKFRPLMESLGFENYGEPQFAALPDGNRMDQPLRTETRGKHERWLAGKKATLGRLQRKGYEIIDPGWPALAQAAESAV